MKSICAHRKSIIVVLAGLVVVIQSLLTPLAGVVAEANRASSAAAEESILKVGLMQAATNLNPYSAYEDADYVVFSKIYDRLMGYDEDLNVMPIIATSWEVDRWPEADNPDTPSVDEGANRLWRYTITEEATWHDGERVTTEDVAFSININLNDTMWGFSPYINWRMAEYARAINDTIVEVYLIIPSVHVDSLIIPIMPVHIWGQYTAGEIQNTVENDFPIGSGPFKFVEFEKDQYVLLERNPDYHLGPVAYDKLLFRFYGSEQVMAQALLNGDIDVGKFPPSTFDALKEEEGVFTAAVDRYYQSTLGFNCFEDSGSQGDPLLRDENVRRAMHLAIDKQYIIDTVWKGYADIGYALPAPVAPEFYWEPTAEESLSFDLERANEILNASGYDDWDSSGTRLVNTTDNPHATFGTPLEFKFQIRNDAPEDYTAAPYIQEMWEDIGVKVNIELIDESALETAVYWQASHEAYIWYWSGDYDPTYILGVMTEDQFWGWNDPFWSNVTYDELYLLQMQQDGAERQATVFEMERIWYESSGMIVLSYPYGLYAWTEKHFTNWGDPVNHPGRTIDTYFGADPMYMMLEPVEGGGDDGGGLSSAAMLGIGVAVAAVAAIVVVAMLMKKRKAGGPGEGAPEKAEKKTGLE